MAGARTAARDAIIFGGLNPNAPETADLIQLFENPEQALISAGVKADRPTIPLVRENRRLQNDLKAIAKNAKKISALDKKTLRAEASYNKKATKLEDKIKKNEEQIERKKVAKITGEGAANEGGTAKATPKGYSLNAPCPCGSGLKYKRCCGKNKS